MIKCPNNECGFENQDGSKFCSICGAKLEAKLCCALCGAEIKEGSKFCRTCGAKVAEKNDVAETHNVENIEQQSIVTPKEDVPLSPIQREDTNTMPKEWYFLKGSEQTGPFTLSYIKQLISCGQIERETLVWKNGMPDWTMAVNSDLSIYFANVVPVVPTKAITDKWLWGMATLPLICTMIFIEIVRGSYMAQSTFNSMLSLLFIGSQSIMGYLDDNEFKKIGKKNPVPWAASILAPVYLFLRADRKDAKSYGPFVVWLVGLLVVRIMIS